MFWPLRFHTREHFHIIGQKKGSTLSGVLPSSLVHRRSFGACQRCLCRAQMKRFSQEGAMFIIVRLWIQVTGLDEFRSRHANIGYKIRMGASKSVAGRNRHRRIACAMKKQDGRFALWQVQLVEIIKIDAGALRRDAFGNAGNERRQKALSSLEDKRGAPIEGWRIEHESLGIAPVG